MVSIESAVSFAPLHPADFVNFVGWGWGGGGAGRGGARRAFRGKGGRLSKPTFNFLFSVSEIVPKGSKPFLMS